MIIGTFAFVRLFTNYFFVTENRGGKIAAILDALPAVLVGMASA
jgi:hypothetical protein